MENDIEAIKSYRPMTPDLRDIFEMSQALNTLMPTKDGNEGIILPTGWEFQQIPHEHRRPDHIRQRITFENIQDFATYVKAHDQKDTLVIRDENTMTAVLDYHGSQANHCDHIARFAPELSDEWKIWRIKDRQSFSQQAFAEFIQDNSDDVIDPVGSEFLEIISTLQSSKNVSFNSSQRLSDGNVQFSYVEESKATAGKTGNLTIPEVITLKIPFFKSDPGLKVELRARFRHRISEGKLTFHYVLNRPENALKSAFDKLIQEYSGAVDKHLHPHYGSL